MGNADFELMTNLINISTEKGVYKYSVEKYDEKKIKKDFEEDFLNQAVNDELLYSPGMVVILPNDL
jgi:hypothetical protein